MTAYLNTPEEFLAWEPSDQAALLTASYYYDGLSIFTPCVVEGDAARIKSFLEKMAQPARYSKMKEYSYDPLCRVKIMEYDSDGDPI